MFIEVHVCVSCRMSYSIVSDLCISFSGLITSVWEEGAFFILSFTCNVVPDRRGVLFLLVLGIGCVNLLWHSLGFPYLKFCSTMCFIVSGITVLKKNLHVFIIGFTQSFLLIVSKQIYAVSCFQQSVIVNF